MQFYWPSHLFGKIQNVNVHFMLTVLLIIWWEFAILTDRSMYKYWELANLADRPIDLGNFNIIICTFMYLFIIWWEFAILADRPYKIEINIDDFEWLFLLRSRSCVYVHKLKHQYYFYIKIKDWEFSKISVILYHLPQIYDLDAVGEKKPA